jgi:hypothetical protein
VRNTFLFNSFVFCQVHLAPCPSRLGFPRAVRSISC